MDTTNQLPPFPAFPCASRYVPHGCVEETLARIHRSIRSRDGISVVIGPPGTGKSLICNQLARDFKESHNVVVVGDTTIQDVNGLQRHVLHHLGVDLKDVQGDLHLALADFVCGPASAEDGLLLIVDEGQNLSQEVLEAIRMTTNVMREGEPRVSTVICGGVKLEETMTAPAMESFVQRVSTRCYLHPLNAQESRYYIRESIRNCGGDPDHTISDEAIGAIHHACSGVPRLINQLMTEAIDCAADADQDHICEQVIDTAWANLQQLPSPMVEEPEITNTNVSPVEFGALSADDALSSSDFAECEQETETEDKPTAACETVCEEPSTEHQEEQPVSSPGCGSCGATSEEPVFAELKPDTQSSPACQETNVAPEPPVFDDLDCDPAEQPADIAARRETSYQEIEINRDEFDFQAIDFDESMNRSQPVDEHSAENVASDVARHIPKPAPLPRVLFGEYEQEEDVRVSPRSQPAEPMLNRATELESEIHEEIVNLSRLANETLFSTEAPLVGPNSRASDVVWMEEPREHFRPLPGAPEPIQVRDDSDIIVIEDDVSISRVVQPTQTAVRQDRSNVDYRDMLHKMRSGS